MGAEQLGQEQQGREATASVRARSDARTAPARRTMRVGAADDRAEHEADAIADTVMRRLDSAGPTRVVRRSTMGTPADTPTIGAEGGELDAGTDRAVRTARGGGQAMDGATRDRMEGAFGADFGRIRIHTDARADRLSRDISAEAFTTGPDVFFRSGAYQPGSSGGDRVLAHELAHTVQQGAASASKVRRSTVRPETVQRLFGNNRKQRIKKNSYPKIEAVVTKAQQGTATTGELIEAQAAVRRHMQTASNMQGAEEQLATLRYLNDELNFGIDRLSANASKQQAKDVYLNDARGGKMQALSGPARGYFGANFKGPQSGKDHGLSQAESAAISTYTADDYKYINPAAEFSSSWMQAQMKGSNQTGTEKERFEEGGLHAAMVMEGLNKLPVWQGSGFRGERLTPAEFADRYTEQGSTITPKQKVQTKGSFWSISTLEDKSRIFANGGGAKMADDKTVHVMYFIDVTNARNVMEFSAVKTENEVLAPAGSKFEVTKVDKLDTGPVGVPPATAWYHVHMRQTK